MKTINITEEAQRAIRSAAVFPFRETAIRRPDGTWDVELEDSTAERLQSVQVQGETLSDTIVRILATGGTRKTN